LAQRAKAEKRRYHAARGQDAETYEHVDDGPVIDYSGGGFARPGELKPQARGQHWAHDQVTRIQRLHTAQISGADDDVPRHGVRPWDGLRARQQQADDRVEFPPALGSPVYGDNPFYSRGEPREITNWASEGLLFRPNPAAGEQALYEHLTRRK
jgi:hypothetical protein